MRRILIWDLDVTLVSTNYSIVCDTRWHKIVVLSHVINKISLLFLYQLSPIADGNPTDAGKQYFM